MVVVTNGPQLSDRKRSSPTCSSRNLSSGDLDACTAHLTPHTQALTLQESTFQVQGQQHSQKGDQVYHAFAFEKPFRHKQCYRYGTAFTPPAGPYKTYEEQQTNKLYALTHTGHNAFGTLHPEGDVPILQTGCQKTHTCRHQSPFTE